VDATVTIQGLRSIPANLPVNPTAVAGDINVVLNVEEGDNTVTGIDLIWDGVAIGCATVNTNVASRGEGVSLSTGGAADDVECFCNTDDAAGVCAGVQLSPAFDNGTATLGARITLDDGTTRDANNAQTVTLVNNDFIMVVHNDAGDLNGQGLVGTNGRRYWGGPADVDGDGTDDNTLQFAACPVSYEGITVGELSMQGLTDAGGADVDLGGGSGLAEADDTSPFIWTADADDNLGVEDSPATGDNGHSVFTTGSIFDDAGLNVTGEFAHGTLLATLAEPLVAPVGMYLDFMPPAVAGGASVSIDGAPAGNVHYSDGNDFGVTGVTDAGVGFILGSGTIIAAGDCGEADNVDFDYATDFVPGTGMDDVTATDDLPEDDETVDADTNAFDCYIAEVQLLQDELSNATDLTAVGPPTIATFANPWGVDRVEADLSEIEPDATVTILSPCVAGSACNGTDVDDFTLMFEADDPDLESGDAGSQVDETGCPAGGPCTNITVEILTAPVAAMEGTFIPVDDGGAAGNSIFVVDYGDGVVAPGEATTLPDGDYVLELLVDDSAVPANTAMHTWSFNMDATAPTFSAFTPLPVGSTGTTASSVIETIGGTVSDANIMSSVVLGVYVDGTDTIGTGADGVCDSAADYLLDDTAGEIDRNSIVLDDGTNSITFNETFEIFDPAPAAAVNTTVVYCYIITASDSSMDKFADAAPNTADQSGKATVVWEP
jgi:hypothetical protein